MGVGGFGDRRGVVVEVWGCGDLGCLGMGVRRQGWFIGRGMGMRRQGWFIGRGMGMRR